MTRLVYGGAGRTRGCRASRRSTLLQCGLATLLVTLTAAVAPASGALPMVKYGEAAIEHACYAEHATLAPVVIELHEGGYKAQARECEDETRMAALQKIGGFTAISLDWPQDNPAEHIAAFPMEVEAAERAVRWVQAHGPEINADPSNIKLLGFSSGGNLALNAAERIDAETPGVVRAVASSSGATNLVSEAAIFKLDWEEGVFNKLGTVEDALGCSLKLNGCALSWQEMWSPIDHIDPATCPAFYLAGMEHDGLLTNAEPGPQNEMRAAVEARRPCEVVRRVVEGTGHAPWEKIYKEVIAWLQAH